MPASTRQGGTLGCESSPNTLQHMNLLFIYLLLGPSIANLPVTFFKLSTYANILARYLPPAIRMSWGPYPAESNGRTYAWPTQVDYSHNYGPSGALELVLCFLSRLFLIISLLASLFDNAINPIITNSQINTICTTQIQARSTGA